MATFFGGMVAEPHRKRIGMIVRDLKALEATPDKLRHRVANYRMHFPNAACTDTAIVKHWHTCASAPLLPGQKPYPSPEEIDRLLIEGWEQDNGPDLVRRAKEQAAKEQGGKP